MKRNIKKTATKEYQEYVLFTILFCLMRPLAERSHTEWIFGPLSMGPGILFCFG